jgi:hypothetical protein
LLILNPALLSRSDTLSRWAGFDTLHTFGSPDGSLEQKKLLLDLDSYLELLTTVPLLIIVSSSLLEFSSAATLVRIQGTRSRGSAPPNRDRPRTPQVEALVVWASCVFFVCVCVLAPVASDAHGVYVRPEIFITFLATLVYLSAPRPRAPMPVPPAPAPRVVAAPAPEDPPPDAEDGGRSPRRAGAARGARRREGRAAGLAEAFDALHRRLAVLRLSEGDGGGVERDGGHGAWLDAVEAVLFSLHDDQEKPDSQAAPLFFQERRVSHRG